MTRWHQVGQDADLFYRQHRTFVRGLGASPVWDLAGLIGSTGWGLWVAALGVTLLLRPTAT